MHAAPVLVGAIGLASIACHPASGDDGRMEGGVVSAPSTIAPGAPRPGMVWIPTGVLRAGSALDEVPRLADVEMPGPELPMGGFYIDTLPWPDEVGAIPTTNVSREEAVRL